MDHDETCPLFYEVSDFQPAPEHSHCHGLEGFLKLIINGCFVINDVALRRTREGRPYVRMPYKRVEGGKHYDLAFPISHKERARLEAQVLAQLVEVDT